jgi:hypothetical protein
MKAAMLHVREIDGKEAELKLKGIDGTPLRLVRTDVLGREISERSLRIMPWETAFYRVYW